MWMLGLGIFLYVFMVMVLYFVEEVFIGNVVGL